MGKYLLADRTEHTSQNLSYDVTKSGTLQKMSENRLKNFAWKCRSRQYGYFLEKKQGGRRKQRIKAWCWNTTGKLNREEPFYFKSWLKKFFSSHRMPSLGGSESPAVSPHGIWLRFCHRQRLCDHLTVNDWECAKSREEDSLTEWRRHFLVSQLMLLETAFSTAAAFGLIIERWEVG